MLPIALCALLAASPMRGELQLELEEARAELTPTGWFAPGIVLMAGGVASVLGGVSTGFYNPPCSTIICFNLFPSVREPTTEGNIAIALGMTSLVAGVVMMAVVSYLRHEVFKRIWPLEAALES